MGHEDRKGGNGLKIWLSRWQARSVGENFKRLESELEEASSSGARVIVFPELFLTGYAGRLDPSLARERFSSLSAVHGDRIILFGTISEEGKNRATMWLGGREILRYDKVNLFLPNREQEMWARGEYYSAAETPCGRIGVAVCNDIRFPEAARTLRLEQEITLLLVPAWWPWRRNGTWRALLKARAIENAMHVAGCCVESADAGGERFAGAGNYLFDPLGNEVATADDRSYEVETPFSAEVLVDPLKARSARRESKLFRV